MRRWRPAGCAARGRDQPAQVQPDVPPCAHGRLLCGDQRWGPAAARAASAGRVHGSACRTRGASLLAMQAARQLGEPPERVHNSWGHDAGPVCHPAVLVLLLTLCALDARPLQTSSGSTTLDAPRGKLGLPLQRFWTLPCGAAAAVARLAARPPLLHLPFVTLSAGQAGYQALPRKGERGREALHAQI